MVAGEAGWVGWCTIDGYRVGELVREIIRRARACRWKPHAALFKLNPVRIIIGGQLGPSRAAHSAGSHLRIHRGKEESEGRERERERGGIDREEERNERENEGGEEEGERGLSEGSRGRRWEKKRPGEKEVRRRWRWLGWRERPRHHDLGE